MFLSDHTERMFGLYGYAGTGKTSTITEWIHFLIDNNYIKSIAFTAPTNKAVNICKSKFRNHAIQLCNKYIFSDEKTKDKINKDTSNITLDELVEKLSTVGLKIDFITIHRLLNYKNDFDIMGDRIFVKGNKNLLGDYDLIIIDECSMIPLQIISNIVDDVYNENICSENYKKVPKIIFLGDTAQLPPVNEVNSSIFIKDKMELKEEDYISAFPKGADGGLYIIGDEVRTKVDKLASRIIKMNYTILKQIVRNSNQTVNLLCYEIRRWVDNEINAPKINKYVDKQYVKLYSCYNKNEKKFIEKTQSKWFKKYLSDLNSGTCNIILTWTNRQTDAYNNYARKQIFKDKKNVAEYEIGDVLILNDFYNINESNVNCVGNDDKFYTSEQIVVREAEEETYYGQEFTDSISKTASKIKGINHILDVYKKTISVLNKRTTRQYKIWKLKASRLTDTTVKNTIPELYTINVIQNQNKDLWEAEKHTAIEFIRRLRESLKKQFSQQIKSIDRLLIKPLWRELSRIMIDSFANVNYGFSITSHKSQGSTFYNVYIDADDILENPNSNESKRCMYTSLTRASNEIHILI